MWGVATRLFVACEPPRADCDSSRDFCDSTQRGPSYNRTNNIQFTEIKDLILSSNSQSMIVQNSSMAKEIGGNIKQNSGDTSQACPNRDKTSDGKEGKEQVKYVYVSRTKQPVTVEIFDRSLNTLANKTYLNDEIIQFYIAFLVSECCDDPKKFHVFDSIFHSRLVKLFPKDPDKSFDLAAWQSLKSWLSDINIFEKDFLIFPVCREKHWTAIIVCYANEVREYDGTSASPDSNSSSRYKPVAGIMHLDSLRAPDWKKFLPTNEVRYFLDFEWRTRLTVIKDFFYHNLQEYHPNLPQQTNAHDCGIFMLAYLRAFIKEPEKFYRLVRKESDKEAQMNLNQMINNSLVHCTRDSIKSLIARVCKSKK